MKKLLTILTIFLMIVSFNICQPTIAILNHEETTVSLLESDFSEIVIMDIPISFEDITYNNPIPSAITDNPDTFNWKNLDGVDWTTPVKNQGNCGSCWDFAAIGTLESIIKIRENSSGINPDLSEQYVLSCLPAAANFYGQGCMGGSPYNAFRCMMDTKNNGNFHNGALPESCMPYQADDDVPCEEKCENWKDYLIPISDCGEQFIGFDDPEVRNTIKSLIYQHGPISAGMNCTDEFIQWGSYHHRETEYYPDTNEPWGNRLNHIIVIVGWNDDATIENGGYWICKNSWGAQWGYDGFFNIEYGGLFTGTYIAWVDYSPDNLRPLKPEIPNGPLTGEIKTEYTFSSSTTDPEGDEIYYLFDWGDETNSDWLGPYRNGDSCEISHSWNKKINCEIKVKARDTHNYESEWSDPLTVSLSKNKIHSNTLLYPYFEQYPLILKFLIKIIKN